MKTSTPETPKARSPLSILLIGPPGAGKTTLAMQFPSPHFLDCDENLDGPERFLRGKNAALSYSYDRIKYNDKDEPLDADVCFDRLMSKIDAAKNDVGIKTVIIDSLTLINEFIIRKILTDQASTKKKSDEMEARDWIPFKSHFLKLLASKIRGLGKDCICTVHQSIIYAPDPKDIMNKIITAYVPSVQGSITDYFGAFFTDVWRCEARLGAGNRQNFVLITSSTSRSDLKNSLNMPHEIENVSYEKLLPYLNGTAK